MANKKKYTGRGIIGIPSISKARFTEVSIYAKSERAGIDYYWTKDISSQPVAIPSCLIRLIS